MSFHLGIILRKTRNRKQLEQQIKSTQSVAPAKTTSDQEQKVFESKVSMPTVSVNPQTPESSNNGLLGNVRAALFSGGVSSGGIFSYGKRQSSNGIIGRLFG